MLNSSLKERRAPHGPDSTTFLADVQRYADSVLRPTALLTDRVGVSPERVAELGSLGLLNHLAPLAYGGTGLDRGVDRQLHETIAGGCFNTWLVWAQHAPLVGRLAGAAQPISTRRPRHAARHDPQPDNGFRADNDIRADRDHLMTATFLWYIPNQNSPGHRGEPVTAHHNSLDTLTEHAVALEQNGWTGALLGAGWGRPDTFTVATALAARTTTFEPLIAIRPGYWRPANFAAAAATLDHLTGGRVRVNIVSGKDDLPAYGDVEGDSTERYARTKEFLQLVRRLWTQEHVTYAGEHYQVTDSTVRPRITVRGERTHPMLYFGGASAAAERVSAAEADVQLFWGEPLDGIRERIERLRSLSDELGREHAPLEYGLRVTTVIRDTSEQAWADAEAKVAELARQHAPSDEVNPHRRSAVGQQRLFDLQSRGEVLDSNLYTTPGKYGAGGAATTWLVGSAEEVAKALQRYADLGITHFMLSDTPYLREIGRQGQQLLPLLRG